MPRTGRPGFLAAASSARPSPPCWCSRNGSRRTLDFPRGRMTDTLDRATIEKAYARWAPVYDVVFGKVFERGRLASIEAAERIGGRILEVGVGTGISLPDYSPVNTIFGCDLSDAMLDKARARVRELGLKHVQGLAVMDAEHLDFPDNSFDVVVAQYVITAVPDPEAALDEFARV